MATLKTAQRQEPTEHAEEVKLQRRQIRHETLRHGGGKGRLKKEGRKGNYELNKTLQ